MNAYKPFATYVALSVLAVVIVVGLLSVFDTNLITSGSRREMTPSPSEVSFSPNEDLERSDRDLIDSAHSRIDITMYAFTDDRIEDALAGAAKKGVRIRIYRDYSQLADERSRASRNNKTAPTDELKDLPGVQIKFKAPGSDMHLKAYCVDGRILRTGSANWSPRGETLQDNDLYLIQDPRTVAKFETDFEELWDRPNNTDVR